MRFWQLSAPDYESDYRHAYINGSLEHPFGMPGIKCDICHKTWSGGRILPLECPASLRKHKNIKSGWPIPGEQHRALRAEVHDCFRQASIACPPLLPGDYFQPCYLDVPSKPKADFLWAGIRSMVVSERIKELFEGMEMRSGFFCPVTLRRIGRRNARLPARIPSTGEPEDIINKAPLLASTGSVGKYYEFVLEAKSGCAPEIERLSVPLTVCSGCGYKTFPSRSPTLEFFMDDSMWKGHDIFFLAVSHYKVISDKLRTALCQLNATNVEISQFCTSRPSR